MYKAVEVTLAALLVVAAADIVPPLNNPPWNTVSAVDEAPMMLNVVTLTSGLIEAPAIEPRLRNEYPASVGSLYTPITRLVVGDGLASVGLIRMVGTFPPVLMTPRTVVVSETVLGPAL